VVAAAVPQAGWLHLDLPRTLGGVKRSYGWPIGSLSAHLALPASALGGARGWAAPAQSPQDAATGEPFTLPSPAAESAEPTDSEIGQPLEPTPEAPLKPEPQTSESRHPRRIPQSDIIFVGRPKAVRPERDAGILARQTLAPEPPKPAPRSALVPKLRSRLRPWLAAVASLAMVGASFYGGTQWSRWQVSAAPAVTGRAAG